MVKRMSNNSNGRKFETEFCEYLAKWQFWVHNMTQNRSGQPADVLAVRSTKAYLIDCKDCERDRFTFSRIEENQHSAMSLWENCGNGTAWFAIRLSDKKIVMIGYQAMLALSKDKKSINREEILKHGISVFDWAKARTT